MSQKNGLKHYTEWWALEKGYWLTVISATKRWKRINVYSKKKNEIMFELFWRLLPLGHLKASRWHKNILQDSLVLDERVMRETSWPHIYCFENLSDLHISMYDIHQHREVVSVSIFTPTTGILQLQTCAAKAQIWPCQVIAGSLQLLAGAWKTNEPNKLLRELVLDY